MLATLETIDVSPRDFFFELYGLSPEAPGTVPFPTRPERAASGGDAAALPRERQQIDRLVDRAVREARRRLRPDPDELRDLVGRMVREELEQKASAPPQRTAHPGEPS